MCMYAFDSSSTYRCHGRVCARECSISIQFIIIIDHYYYFIIIYYSSYYLFIDNTSSSILYSVKNSSCVIGLARFTIDARGVCYSTTFYSV